MIEKNLRFPLLVALQCTDKGGELVEAGAKSSLVIPGT
jgi:hypothetical protein